MSTVRSLIKKIGSAAFIAFGFMLVFFTANSKNLGVHSFDHDSMLGADIAHADGAVSDGGGGGSCTGGDSCASGSGCGGGACGGAGDCGDCG